MMLEKQLYYGYHDSPIGLIEIAGTADAIVSVSFVEARREAAGTTPLIDKAIRQVGEYFAGDRQDFDVSIEFDGTDFQREVWEQLRSIPYGQVVSYQDIAESLERPGAVRAVGAANGQNPVAIVVPCHRVIGSNGDLVGYGGGIWRKEWLLKHEGALLL